MKPKLAASRCLLGDNVRHDGANKSEPRIIEALAGSFELVPFCPEVEAGMGVPREPLTLVFREGEYHLIGAMTGGDFTQKMMNSARNRAKEFWKSGVRGFVLKSKSPSCAFSSAKIVSSDGKIERNDEAGLFITVMREQFPLAPMAEETRLRNGSAMRKFMESAIAFGGWMDFVEKSPSIGGLKKFNESARRTIPSHGPELVDLLDGIVASAENAPIESVLRAYGAAYMSAFR